MYTVVSFLQRFIPSRYRSRRFLLDRYHFDLTSFDGDVSTWLDRFPVTTDNVEMYFGLAELFRRRGEFDKAVSVHEAILNARLDGYSVSEISLEIAQDYYAAGVLSHAEEVLLQALDHADDEISNRAFRLWLSILESEQEWARAVELVEDYGIPGSGGLRLANLYCEMIEEQRRQTPLSRLLKTLKKPQRLGVSARAEIIAAELYTELNRVGDAIQSYREILIREPRRVDLVLSPLKHLSLMNQSVPQLLTFLQQLYQRHPSARILEVYLELSSVQATALADDINAALLEEVQQGDSYSVQLYWLNQQSSDVQQAVAPLLRGWEKRSLEHSDDYLCIECGFYSDKLVWQCPQCESWETLFSRYELKIEQKIKKAS
ncbi:hypothetical protein [Reinekea blandensis]|uniref:TPR domain protein n=1 Tax=Reinekea blandensis MED297 TaxID=314283 RepID=A4BEF5_9GAMM|nr:hypothetical protein [Reinekea blandensis]EAR09382.1 TPR domain protein [Reinekea sp. MED297] [Reinekea blandensis MED297]